MGAFAANVIRLSPIQPFSPPGDIKLSDGQTIAMRHAEMTITYIMVLRLEALASLLMELLFLGEGITLTKLIGVLLVGIGVVVLRL